MTIELIRIGQEDTNNYEENLVNLGHENLDGNLKEDVIAVWGFLCNEALVLSGLKKFREQYYQFSKEGQRSLRQFFDDWGYKNHFNSPSSPELPNEYETNTDFQFPSHTPILCGELTADIFNNVLLKNGYLSSDLGAGPKHGKWAHSIQLFLLEEARKEGVLPLHAKHVCEFVQIISQTKGSFTSLGLWDILFDSFDENLFTCPNHITAVLSANSVSSKEDALLSSKLNAYAGKFNAAAQEDSYYESYAHKKYLSRLNEASSFIRYKDKCSLLWFAPKLKPAITKLTATIESNEQIYTSESPEEKEVGWFSPGGSHKFQTPGSH